MVRVALIGAGAIASQGYLPAVEGLADTDLVAVVDIDEDRARTVARTFGADAYATDYTRILGDVDAVIISTPPSSHAEIAADCLAAGVHVFTEKPVATDSSTAADLIERAEAESLHYGISRQLRESPACRLIRQFVRNGSIGGVRTCTVTYGDQTNWEFASDYRLRGSLSWGGVLPDRGPHVLDILQWTFEEPMTVEGYRDDALGGLEANADLELTIGADTAARLELTSTRAIPNLISVTGDRGTIEADPHGESAILRDTETDDVARVEPGGEPAARSYLARVGAQAHRFLRSIRSDETSYVPAASGLALLELFETSYEMREASLGTWEPVRSATHATLI